MPAKPQAIDTASLPARKARLGGRSARVLEQVAEAAIAELCEAGIVGFSMPRVAQRAEVNTATIYRRWPNAAALIAYAAASLARQEMPAPDTGSLEGDLRARLKNLRAFLDDPRSALLVSIAFASGDDPELVRMKREYWSGRAADRAAMFRRACLRGELDPGADFEAMMELAIGPLYVRRFISMQPLDDAFIERIVASALLFAGRT